MAAALHAELGAGAMRLALVISSREALFMALRAAAAKRQGDDSAAWSTRGGAHFASAPLAGKLAFIFPGEG